MVCGIQMVLSSRLMTHHPPNRSCFTFSFVVLPTIFGIRGFAQMRSPGWRCGWTWICTTSRRGAGCSPCRSMPSCGKWCWPFVLLFAACFRFGEALHPGPAGLGADTWSLGIANPSGLNGKLDQLSSLDTCILLSCIRYWT